MKYRTLAIALVAGLPMVGIVGCSTAPTTTSDQRSLDNDATTALRQALAADPTLWPVLNSSAGYAVFPNAGRGGLIVGGAYGKGVLYEHGQISGYCDLTAVSAGAKIGGEKFAEIIAFKTPDALAKFKANQFSWDANASAVAIKSGAAANAQFRDNVAVFTYDQAGLMADASVGGQSFRFTPLSTARQAAGAVEGTQNAPQQINTNTNTNPGNY